MEVKSKVELDKLILKKQNEQKEAFARLKEDHVLDERTKFILDLKDQEIIENLQTRSIKAVEVLKAFICKTLIVNENVNCVTEFIPNAKGWAEDLDNLKTIKGPLHGLPIAVKDDFDIEGMDTTLGYAKRLYQPAKETAVFIKILLDLGAVPFVKTNVSQTLFSYGSDNPIFGKTLNSKNPLLSPGGSSSGSGCIVGSDAAVFAAGSDLGGSLRIPAHFNGVCSLKTTVNRLSAKGLVQCLPKLVGFTGVPGIIARKAKTLALVYSHMLKDNRQNAKDAKVVPIPWNEQLFSSKSKLKIGYFTTLPFFPSIGDTPKVVLNAKNALESMGHIVVPFQMPDDFHYITLINSLINADGGKYFREMLTNEQIADAVKDMAEGAFKAECNTELSVTVGELEDLGSKRAHLIAMTGLDARKSEDLWDKMAERKSIIDEMLNRMDKTGVDVILSPAFPFPAIKLEAAPKQQLLWSIVYTMIWNLVDFPAGVVRFGTESGIDIDKYDDEGDSMLRMAKESLSESAGMPICLQVIARPFREEVVLRTMVELEQCNVPNLSNVFY